MDCLDDIPLEGKSKKGAKQNQKKQSEYRYIGPEQWKLEEPSANSSTQKAHTQPCECENCKPKSWVPCPIQYWMTVTREKIIEYCETCQKYGHSQENCVWLKQTLEQTARNLRIKGNLIIDPWWKIESITPAQPGFTNKEGAKGPGPQVGPNQQVERFQGANLGNSFESPIANLYALDSIKGELASTNSRLSKLTEEVSDLIKKVKDK